MQPSVGCYLVRQQDSSASPKTRIAHKGDANVVRSSSVRSGSRRRHAQELPGSPCVRAVRSQGGRCPMRTLTNACTHARTSTRTRMRACRLVCARFLIWLVPVVARTRDHYGDELRQSRLPRMRPRGGRSHLSPHRVPVSLWRGVARSPLYSGAAHTSSGPQTRGLATGHGAQGGLGRPRVPPSISFFVAALDTSERGGPPKDRRRSAAALAAWLRAAALNAHRRLGSRCEAPCVSRLVSFGSAVCGLNPHACLRGMCRLFHRPDPL